MVVQIHRLSCFNRMDLGVATMPTLVFFNPLLYLHAITLIVLLTLRLCCTVDIFRAFYRIYHVDGAKIKDTNY